MFCISLHSSCTPANYEREWGGGGGGGGAYSGETAYWSMGAYSRKYGIPLSLIFETIVRRGDWLANPANIKVENNGTVGHVGSSLIVHNPLFLVHKL